MRSPWEQMPPLDRYMLTRTRELTEKILRWYEDFEFHRIYQALNEFAVAELSALYIDAVKDRIYTFAPQNPDRRSAQTVLWMIAEALVRLVAPLLSFTADEIWHYMPEMSNRLPSVHLELFPAPESLAATIDTNFMEDWATLLSDSRRGPEKSGGSAAGKADWQGARCQVACWKYQTRWVLCWSATRRA